MYDTQLTVYNLQCTVEKLLFYFGASGTAKGMIGKMVTHIVMFKLKDTGKANLEKTRDILLSMDGKIDLLRHIEVGIDVLHSERSYDVVLVTKFDSLEDLEAYQEDPYHVEVVKKHMHAVRESSVAVDYIC